MSKRGVNKVILIGNLGADPEVRYTQNGNAIANVRLATSEQWRDRNTGETQERTEWHRVVFFGKLAEIVQQYLRKGSKIYVEGKLQTRKWQDQSGQERYNTEIVVDIDGSMQMLDSRGAGSSAPFDDGASPPGRAPRQGGGIAQGAPPYSEAPSNPSAQGSGQGSGQGGFGQQASAPPPPSDFDDEVPF